MVLQYAKGGNFNDWINKNYQNFTWSSKIQALFNIISGLKEIHQKQMVHRDLHTGNILFQLATQIYSIIAIYYSNQI